MADINLVTANRVAIVGFPVRQLTLPAAEAITAGMAVRHDTSTGKFTKANATDAAEGRVWGIATQTVIAGYALTAVATGLHSGWQNLDGNWDTRARRYVADLLWYAKQLAADPRILGACIFTHDHQDRYWESFNTRNDIFLRHFLSALAAEPEPQPWGNRQVWRWRFLCNRYGDAYGLDPRLIAAVMLQESGGNPFVVAGAHDTGLMQVVAREQGGAFANRPPVLLLKNPDLNVHLGAGILRESINAFGGSVAYGLVAYNRGVGGVRNLDRESPGLRHPSLQATLQAYAGRWKALWGEPYPGDVGSYLQGYTPPPEPEPEPTADPLNDPTWLTEEATREVEEAQRRLARARDLQKEATRRLYVVRGLTPPQAEQTAS